MIVVWGQVLLRRNSSLSAAKSSTTTTATQATTTSTTSVTITTTISKAPATDSTSTTTMITYKSETPTPIPADPVRFPPIHTDSDDLSYFCYFVTKTLEKWLDHLMILALLPVLLFGLNLFRTVQTIPFKLVLCYFVSKTLEKWLVHFMILALLSVLLFDLDLFRTVQTIPFKLAFCLKVSEKVVMVRSDLLNQRSNSSFDVCLLNSDVKFSGQSCNDCNDSDCKSAQSM